MRAKVDAIILAVEDKVGKNGPYVVVRFGDSTGKGCELVDYNMDRKPLYIPASKGVFTVDIDVKMNWEKKTQYTKQTIVDYEAVPW